MQATTKRAASAPEPERELQEEPQTELPGAPGHAELTAAITPVEEPMIEGEVIAVIEPEPPHTPKQPPYYLLVVATILACLLFTAISLLLPFFSSTVTVTILPSEHMLSTTTSVEVQGRALPILTLSQSQTVPATGQGHQDSTQARGSVTFYNASPNAQTITAGELLISQSGVRVVTDEAASLPGANPPVDAAATVKAHALNAGRRGNIAAGEINGECCKEYVLVRNKEAFTGGAAARAYVMITRADVDNAATTITTTLLKSEDAAFTSQLNPGEALLTPSCTPTTTANHHPGEEATNVTVTESETCSGSAYAAQALHQLAKQILPAEAAKRLGTDYSLIGESRISIVHATITDQTRGVATIVVKVDATYVYQITQAEKQHMMNLIAGKPQAQAITILLQFPGIQAASIQFSGGRAAVPDNPNNIQLIVMYQTS